MNRFYKSAFCMIVAVVFSCAIARAETVDRIVANVNGEIILYSELQNRIKMLEKNMPTLDAKDPAKRAQIEREVLNQMIQQKLADMEAVRLQVSVAKLDIEQKIQQINEQNHMTMEQLELALKANGQTLDQYREQVKKDLEREALLNRVLKSKILISDQQVEAYLRGETGESATTSKKIHLGMIVLPVGDEYGKPQEVAKTGHEIVEKLKGGADFKDLAKQYSKGPTASDGGDLGYMAPEDLAPFIAQGVHNLKKDQVSALLEGPAGYYIMKVFDTDTKRVEKSDPALREKVRRTLYEKEMNRKFEEWARDLVSKAFIQISL